MTKLDDYLAHNPQLKGEKWLWKKSAAAALEVSEKTLYRAASGGKIAAMEKDNKTYYLIEDLRKFEENKTSEILKAVPADDADTDGRTRTNALVKKSDTNQLLNAFAGMFQQINEKLDDRRAESNLQKVSNKISLDIDEAAHFSGFGKTQILKAIHRAEEKGELKRFSGERGKAVWKCEDLDRIIENLPPVEIKKRQPPTKKGK